MTTTDDLLKEISNKLDRMTKLLAASIIKDYGTEQEKIELLVSMGFTSSEIAKVLNKSIQNVCVQLSLISKKKEKLEKKATKAEDGTPTQSSTEEVPKS
ncbi:MAG: hypothetical protein ABSF44_09460 [Candidatus Bathyarchaeia archaeon]|jgi:DNA-binding NarL/FixJ family response regulator